MKTHLLKEMNKMKYFFPTSAPFHFSIYLCQSRYPASQKKRQPGQSHTKTIFKYLILFITIAIWIKQPSGYLSARFKAKAMKKNWWPQNRKPKQLQLKWENKSLNRDPRQGITGSNLSDEGGPLDFEWKSLAKLWERLWGKKETQRSLWWKW